MNLENKEYNIVIVGGGVSGTALLYTLSKYTTIKNIALLEKYSTLGHVNSNAKNNSQTLHVGDIETNYSLAKVQEVKPASMMVKYYTDSLDENSRKNVIRKVQKMVLAVGKNEVKELNERFNFLKDIFPEIKKLDAVGIAEVEPEVMKGRNKDEEVTALFNAEGYAVNFEKLSQSFANEAEKQIEKNIQVLVNHKVKEIKKIKSGYVLKTNKENITARVVIVNTDAYSLGFAKQLGYGKEFSLIPIAGSFYFTKELLRGKVYRVQNPAMPFAAVHGDPDLTVGGVTRWGPTARFYPVLEAGKIKTTFAFLKSSGLHRFQTWISFLSILFEPVRFWYLLKNLLYEIPFFGKYIFLPQIKTIVPSIKVSDIKKAKGYGGMRLQRVDTNKKELLLGEGKIIGKNIIFNMTPSPGASVCLYNAMRDAEEITKFSNEFVFDKEQMTKDLIK